MRTYSEQVQINIDALGDRTDLETAGLDDQLRTVSLIAQNKEMLMLSDFYDEEIIGDELQYLKNVDNQCTLYSLSDYPEGVVTNPMFLNLQINYN